MKTLILFLIALLCFTHPLQANNESLAQRKAELKKEIHHELAEGRAEFKRLQQKAAASKQSVAHKSQQAMEQAESDLRILETQTSKVGRATQEDWEEIKTTAHSSIEHAKKSLASAKSKLEREL